MDKTRNETTGKTRRREESGRPRSEESRRAILDATMKHLISTELRSITVESIAKTAGVGKTTIYRWWPSRTDLVLEAIEELPLLEVRDHGDFAEDLRDLIGQLADMLTETPLGKVLAHFAADQSAQRESNVREYFNRRMEPIRQLVHRAVERGELPSGTDVDAEEFIYMVMGPVVNRTFFGVGPADAAFVDLIVGTLTRGYAGYLSAK